MVNKKAIEILTNMRDMKPFLVDGETYESQNEAINMGIQALESQRWIPCSEKLPPVSYCRVMVRTSDDVMMARFANGKFFNNLHNELNEVKAWMDIPKSYVEDKSK